MSLVLSDHAALVRHASTSLLGSAVFGLAVAAGYGARSMLQCAWAAPALFLGGAALAVPPLYLFTALAGCTASSTQVVSHTMGSLARVATALFGLTAPAVFFSVTLRTKTVQFLLIGTVAALGAIGVISVASQTVGRESPNRVRWVVSVWCVFALALGARLMAALGRSFAGLS